MKNNFIQKKLPENVKLLSLLTNRQRAKSVSQLKRNDWPGKHTPNFTSIIRIKSGSEQSSRIKFKKQDYNKNNINCYKTNYVTLIPSLNQRELGKLQLKPSFSSHEIMKVNRLTFYNQQSTFGRTNCHLTARTSYPQQNDSNKVMNQIEKVSFQSCESDNPVIKIEQNLNNVVGYQSIFKNSKISDHVVEVIEKKLGYENDRRNKENQAKAQRSNSKIKNRISSLNKTKIMSKVLDKKVENIKGKYKIDYYALGFVDKIIDNPQLWAKYVKKIG